MKTRLLLTVTVLPAAALLLLAGSCNRSDRSAKPWSLPRPVSIAPGEGWVGIFPSWVTWVSGSIDGGTAGLLLRDGDLIMGGDILTVYSASDGPALEFTSNKWGGLLLAGKVVSVSLEKGTEGREWLEKAPAQDLAAIRFLMLPKEPDATLLPTLKRLAAVNPGVGLGVGPNATLQQVLPLFRPRALMIDNASVDAAGRKIVADQPQVETLLVSGEEPGSLGFLPMLHGLRRLALMGWDVEKAGPLPAGLQGLRSIVVSDSAMKDLSALDAAPAEMEELSLTGCKELTDVRALAKRPGLKTLILSLSGGDKAMDLSSLAGLKQLQWVGLPLNTSQDQFAAFIAAHRDLKILELTGCAKVTDLAPLRELKELEGLILNGPYQHLEVVRELKSLRFVGLQKDAFKNSPDQIAEIRKALPDALVVPVGGFCLGSGWILLLVPVVVVASSLAWRRRAVPGSRHA